MEGSAEGPQEGNTCAELEPPLTAHAGRRCGLDVFEDEPAMKPGLADCPNAVIVPHIASASMWTRSGMVRAAPARSFCHTPKRVQHALARSVTHPVACACVLCPPTEFGRMQRAAGSLECVRAC